jgi:two-component system, NarL family, nitrate/nitrite response regulator NarL
VLPTEPSVRLLVLADDPLARAGLVAVLAEAPGLAVVGQADLGPDAAAALAFLAPEVVVVDLGWSPDTALAAMADLDLAIPLLLLAPGAEAAPALAEPVRGLVARDAPAAQLRLAVQAIAGGLAVLGPGFTAGGTGQDHGGDLGASDLTPREREVLGLMAEGLPNKAIARALGISEHTVKFHTNAVMGKLHAQSRTEAVMRAARLGLVAL